MKEEKIISKKEIIMPIISIISFLIIIGSASYAYYSKTIGSATGVANIANANITLPTGCSFVSTSTNCEIASNMDATSTNFADNYISVGEMSQLYSDNRVATATCGLNISVSGTTNCKCLYSVNLNWYTGANTSIFRNSVTFKIDSTNTAHSYAENYFQSAQIVISNTLKVGGTMSENFTMTVNAFNIPQDQSILRAGVFKYRLVATPTCSIA